MNTEAINQLTHKIIGCAMQVHRTSGNGFQEVIYQNSLAIEFAYQEINFEREKEMPIFYRDSRFAAMLFARFPGALPSDLSSRARPCLLNFIQDFANSSRQIFLNDDLSVRDSLSISSHLCRAYT